MIVRTAFFAPVLLTLACGPRVFAQGTTGSAVVTRNYSFAPLGLASTETAQVNVVNNAKQGTSASSPAPVCTGTITFTNASGATAGKAVSFTTTGSEIFSTQLSFAALATSGTRAEFVATVESNSALPPTAPCSLVFSLETFDTQSGVTHVYLGNTAASPLAVPVTVAIR